MPLSKNFIRFLFIGSFNTLVCLAVFQFLLWLKFNYLLASGLMNVFGIIEGYILNAKLLYKSRLHFAELFKYFNVYAISFGVNLALMYLLVGYFGLAKLSAQIVTTGILTIINYQLVKIFVFR